MLFFLNCTMVSVWFKFCRLHSRFWESNLHNETRFITIREIMTPMMILVYIRPV